MNISTQEAGNRTYIRIKTDKCNLAVLQAPALTVKQSLLEAAYELQQQAARLVRRANLYTLAAGESK
jgi:hypothetical protein